MGVIITIECGRREKAVVGIIASMKGTGYYGQNGKCNRL